MHQLTSEDYQKPAGLPDRPAPLPALVPDPGPDGWPDPAERWSDSDDARFTRVRLTADGEKRLEQLTVAHHEELQRLAPVLDQLVAASDTASTDGAAP